jgi:hypothetical protein
MTPLRALLLCACAGLVAACGRGAQPVAQEEAPVVQEAAPAPEPLPTVTEAQVREVIAAADAAVHKFDTHALRKTLAEDVRFVAVPAPTFGPTLRVEGRDRVIAQIHSGWSLIQKPSYSSRGGDVAMSADGASGRIEYAAVSHYSYDRHDYVDESTDAYVVAMRGGEPRIVEMNQTATGLTIDGAKRF